METAVSQVAEVAAHDWESVFHTSKGKVDPCKSHMILLTLFQINSSMLSSTGTSFKVSSS